MKKAKNEQEIINHLASGNEVVVHFKEVFQFKMNPQKISSFQEGSAVVDVGTCLSIDFHNSAVDFWELKCSKETDLNK